MRREDPGVRGLLAGFGLLSLATIAAGGAIGFLEDGSARPWAPNLAAWAVGALSAAGLAARMTPTVRALAVWAAPTGLLASLFAAGQQGVHRWVDLGPLHMNIALLLLPAAMAAFAGEGGARPLPWIAALSALGLLVVQPDASQASALAVVILWVAVRSSGRRSTRLIAAVLAIGLAVFAWKRPDPLLPVPRVEGIVGLAAALSPFAGAALVLLLAATATAPAILTARAPPLQRDAGTALSLALLVWVIAPFLGAFPMPFAGLGPSPILGAWLGVGLLAGQGRLSSLPAAR